MFKPKRWTPHQLNRLPKPGYWLSEFTFTGGKKSYTAYCIMNGAIKYVRDDFNSNWSTLLWSCMPTQKQITNGKPNTVFSYYPTLDDMITANPSLPDTFKSKPVNDF